MSNEKTYSFEYTSTIPSVTLEEVWNQVGSWTGVNYELGPLMRMKYPATYEKLTDIPADGVSRLSLPILLFGIIPLDLHRFSFVGLDEPSYFDERSSNLNMKVWTHKRTLTPVEGGVEVKDECSFVPRLTIMGGLIKTIFSGVFRRRHKRLTGYFAQRAARG